MSVTPAFAKMKFIEVEDTAMEKSPQIAETEVLSVAERDAQALARLGKKPILKV